MKKRLLLSKLMNIVTVIGTLAFILINIENLTCEFSWGLLVFLRPSISLNERYQNLIRHIYGEKEGLEICRKIEKFTVWIIEHHINLLLFVMISLMMALCVTVYKKQYKKMNKILKVYFVICFILMFIATFIAGPEYIDLIHGD